MPDAAADEFAAWCAELLAGSGTVQVRRMFGGHGFRLDGLFVALATGRRLYLKVGPAQRPAFEAAGSQPFVYERRGQATALGYWSAPDAALDGPHAMRPWAERARQAALTAAAAGRTPARRRPPSATVKTPAAPTTAAAPAARTRRRPRPPR